MEKYELTSETKVINGVELHKIKALKSFGNIKKGELGGWIEGEKNLSQDGDSWVYDNAVVYDNARVDDNAKVYNNEWVYGNATVSDNVGAESPQQPKRLRKFYNRGTQKDKAALITIR